MSILLEALRKSEKNQHVRDTPTIHSAEPSGPVSEPFRKGPLVLLLVVALLVSGWFVWRQYQAPAGSYQQPVTLEATEKRAKPKPAVLEKSLDQGSASTAAESSLPGEKDSAAQAAASNFASKKSAPTQTVASNLAGRKRTPVESFEPSENNVVSTKSAEQTEPAGSSNNRLAEKPGSAATRTDPGTSQGLRKPQPEPGSNEKPAETVTEEFHPGEPAPLSYWELPDAIRADVPEIKFSVLVYAADPAARFVLINGQRLAEGDSAQPGLVVEEIQRDGVLFSYRLYRFLVER